MAFNAKNLEYGSKEPAFLQRLRAQTAGDFNERPSPRPKRLRNAEDDEEDEPIYVMEGGDTISSKDFKAMNEEGGPEAEDTMIHEDDTEAKIPTKDNDGVATKDAKPRDVILDVGAKKAKRKVHKIVSDEDAGSAASQDSLAVAAKKPEAKKAKKFLKGSKQKVKLSFGNDEET